MTRQLCLILLSLILLILPLAVGCQDRRTPVVRLEVEPRVLTLSYPRTAELETTWEPAVALPDAAGALQVFVHLLDESGEVVRTFDHGFPAPWQVGRPQSYRIELWQSALAPPLPAATYRLSVGLYGGDGRRWPLAVAGEEIDEGEYVIARVQAPPLGGGGPKAAFAGSWLPIEPVGSQQVLTVRWLEDDGLILFSDLRQPLEAVLSWQVPRLEESGFDLILEEGTAAPELTVGADCTESTARLTGYGSHEVKLLLRPSDGSSSCTVAIETSFHFRHRVHFDRRSAMLERLVWAESSASSD